MICVEKSPLNVHQTAYQAFHECTTYFGELLDIKKKQMNLGESEQGTMDLLGIASSPRLALQSSCSCRTNDQSQLRRSKSRFQDGEPNSSNSHTRRNSRQLFHLPVRRPRDNSQQHPLQHPSTRHEHLRSTPYASRYRLYPRLQARFTILVPQRYAAPLELNGRSCPAGGIETYTCHS